MFVNVNNLKLRKRLNYSASLNSEKCRINIGTTPHFSAILMKGDKVCDFLFASLDHISLPKLDFLFKVGFWSLEGIIMLLIYFLNCRKAHFTKQ